MLTDFINRLVEEKSLENVDSETLTQIKKDLLVRVEDRINVMILEKMPTYKIPEFEKVLDSENSEEIQIFCETYIEDLEQLVASELIDFRKTYLGL